MFAAQLGTAGAFPFIDPTNQDTVPTGAPLGAELPAADVKGLRNQLRLTNPGAAGNPSAWTIIPRLTIQEILTDNAYGVSSPRRPDAVTVISPGISVAADTSRLKLNLDFQPSLVMHAVNGPLNTLVHQLTATGLITVVPDLAFVDVRALSGVQSRLGALSGAGTLGAGTVAPGGVPTDIGYGAGQGANRNNLVQTSSFGLSPYLLRQFGDYGTGKIGASIDVSRYSALNGFTGNPLPLGGSTNGQSLVTTEEIARYSSGDILQKFQYTFDLSLSQSRTQNDALTATAINTATGATVILPQQSFSSQRQTINNQINYALNRKFTFFVSGGYEKIYYGVPNAPNVNGLIWKVGTTVTPSPESSFTVSYGRQNGANAFEASGRLALTARTILTFSYDNTVGTQLQNLQNQLNNSAIGQTGALINAQTGGPVFIQGNGLGVQNGVFRFRTFTTALATQWERDTLQGTLSWSEQTALTPALGVGSILFDPVTGAALIVPTTISTNGPSSEVKTASIYWMHELSPALTLSSNASFSFITRSGSGTDTSLSTAVALQYLATDTMTLHARYSFFDRKSKLPGSSMYENILLVGFTKQF